MLRLHLGVFVLERGATSLARDGNLDAMGWHYSRPPRRWSYLRISPLPPVASCQPVGKDRVCRFDLGGAVVDRVGSIRLHRSHSDRRSFFPVAASCICFSIDWYRKYCLPLFSGTAAAKRSNQPLELTATRRVTTFQMSKILRSHLTLGVGSRSSAPAR